jgi:hypothetical protein
MRENGRQKNVDIYRQSKSSIESNLAIPTVIIAWKLDLRLRETLTSQLEGDKARLEDLREALSLGEGAVLERQEMHRLARAVVVVPDGHAVAEDGVLGVHARAEGIVVDTPIPVDGGLVTSHGSSAHIGRELGLAESGVANVALLPGLEADAGDREAGVGSHGEGGHGGKGLCCVSKLYVSECIS